MPLGGALPAFEMPGTFAGSSTRFADSPGGMFAGSKVLAGSGDILEFDPVLAGAGPPHPAAQTIITNKNATIMSLAI